MVNAHFKYRHVSQFKGLIDLFTYWKWKDKESAKPKEEMLVQFKLEHHSVIKS
jgi:beta-xylosidase